jgi:nucleoside-diphosphate-sugar epimerase
MVVVMGACGTAASKAAEQMLAHKRRVRVVDKSGDCLGSLGEKGAEIFRGDQTDESFLIKAFAGFDTVCVFAHAKLESADSLENHSKMIEAALGAIKKTNINRVVFLSSQMPESETDYPTDPVLRETERKLCELEHVNTVIVRTGIVLEDLFTRSANKKAPGSTDSASPLYNCVSMVTSSEIGEKIAELVDLPPFGGNSIVNVSGIKWMYYQ